MRVVKLGILISVLAAALVAAVPGFATVTQPPAISGWEVVINNGDYIPTDSCDPANPSTACTKFNSYNQASVNAGKLVVIRARSKGGEVTGQKPVHGVYTRDMSVAGSPVVKILDRNTLVPQPNNRSVVFIEPPAFPRIDIYSNTIATRGIHQPTWTDGVDTLGTTGIYTDPFGPLITGASKLGIVPDFPFFEVPGASPRTPFDVFPGSPAVTQGTTMVFKGNYTEGGEGRTGVYYRNLTNDPIPVSTGSPLEPAGGTNPVVLIANNASTLIPGTATLFGSLAPPSAAGDKAVFVGLDNEGSPTIGGIYLVSLTGSEPELKTVIAIGSEVPGESGATFNRFGEGLSFDGRFVAFWGAWGTDTNTLNLQCRAEGNAERVAYCNQLCSTDPANCIRSVPVHQGIFVNDLVTGVTYPIAKTGVDFSDLLFWNFSGLVPGVAPEDDGEPARWRASAFVAVSGLVAGGLADENFHTAFKARKGEAVNGVYANPVDGIYLGVGSTPSSFLTLVETGMDGSVLDGKANGLPVTEVGIERDGFRANSIVINASMASEEDSWAGVYLTKVVTNDGWKSLAWFDNFYTGSSPWIYSEAHGWLYPFGSSPDYIWFWDDKMQGFWWTSETHYPYVYRADDASWLYYVVGTSNLRWFYNLNTENWETG